MRVLDTCHNNKRTQKYKCKNEIMIESRNTFPVPENWYDLVYIDNYDVHKFNNLLIQLNFLFTFINSTTA